MQEQAIEVSRTHLSRSCATLIVVLGARTPTMPIRAHSRSSRSATTAVTMLATETSTAALATTLVKNEDRTLEGEQREAADSFLNPNEEIVQ